MSKIRTKWDLQLLYKSEKDPQIEKDVVSIEDACASFEKKYRGKDFTASTQKLFKALEDKERLMEDWEDKSPWWYFALRTDLDSDDNVAGAMATKLNQRLTKSFNKLKFFGIEVAKVPKATQKKYLKSQLLAPYKYKLERIFKGGDYRLTEEEEQLSSLLSQPAVTMWIDGQEKVLNQKTLQFKGKQIPLSEASSILKDQSKKDRQVLRRGIAEIHMSMADFAESELNAVYNFKKIIDERKGYKKPYSSTALSHQNDEQIIENLTSLVSRNFRISHRFYKLHAKLLKEKKITYVDRAVKIGEIKREFAFNDAVNLVEESFVKVDSKYAEILKEFLKKGQVDVYPRKGKRSGAFCASMGAELPTFVLLNHVDNINSVETLAHEMGHAFHTELSKKQPARYRDYSTATAEVASTFFEQVVLNDMEKVLTPREQIIMLHNKLMGDVASIFRQVACFNFELELHNLIREKGQMPKGEIADLMVKHLRSYLGNAVDVIHEDGYTYVSWHHIRKNFYVYTYAFGQLISRALFEKWQEDPSYAGKIEEFLSAGGSATPADIFKSIGIDIRNPKFFELGLKSIEKDIERLEKLTANYKK